MVKASTSPKVPQVTLAYAKMLLLKGHNQQAFELLISNQTLRYHDVTFGLAIELGNLDYMLSTIKQRSSEADLANFIALLQAVYFDELPIEELDKHRSLFSAQRISYFQVKPAQSCKRTITFLATTIDDIERLSNRLTALSDHPITQVVCPVEVRYLPISWLDCQANSGEPIMCDEQVFNAFTKLVNTDYLGVLLPEGGANVHGGILYLDREDSAEVIAHELGHLAGFIDEYPLRENHLACQQANQVIGRNVVTLSLDNNSTREQLLQLLPWRAQIKETTPLFTVFDGERKVGTPISHQAEVGIFLSETCQKNALINAYKPIKKPNFMRYFELPMPEPYIEMLDEMIKEPASHTFFQPGFRNNLN
ncbi:hypothetical protein LP316_07985 [Thalassotalea sp. LPB0316]|uniref:hypothetical protein n=1 Tax=Thalassotalea sp. LPB0316 TaxID=2769490 RepID=UPI001868A0AD|nr:hypothetical protein [Thalassotalea sp. LPB0316]QOL24326.1 hypothetical protein LP316_07985 [Thalassotalea sp. LPB0316]